MIDQLVEISQELRAGRPVPPTTVRDFLGWFEAQRRGFYVVQKIREQLGQAMISTFPDFESAWIDAPIGFSLAEEASNVNREESDEAKDPLYSEEVSESQDYSPVQFQDPTYRVSTLQAANQKIISIKPDEKITRAITLMMASGVSQMPVMSNERDIKGMITWRTIALQQTLGSAGDTSKEYMEPHHEVRHDSSIFSAIPTIILNDYVLVRSSDNRISGIITASDLSYQFRSLTEPFLLLSEIEKMVRDIISRHFSVAEISQICDPSSSRKIQSVVDLNFGEYIILLREPNRWARTGQRIDRVVFCERLDLVREIRNDVMHFRLGNIKDDDLDSLRSCADFLKSLVTLNKFYAEKAAE